MKLRQKRNPPCVYTDRPKNEDAQGSHMHVRTLPLKSVSAHFLVLIISARNAHLNQITARNDKQRN